MFPLLRSPAGAGRAHSGLRHLPQPPALASPHGFSHPPHRRPVGGPKTRRAEGAPKRPPYLARVLFPAPGSPRSSSTVLPPKRPRGGCRLSPPRARSSRSSISTHAPSSPAAPPPGAGARRAGRAGPGPGSGIPFSRQAPGRCRVGGRAERSVPRRRGGVEAGVCVLSKWPRLFPCENESRLKETLRGGEGDARLPQAKPVRYCASLPPGGLARGTAVNSLKITIGRPVLKGGGTAASAEGVQVGTVNCGAARAGIATARQERSSPQDPPDTDPAFCSFFII